MRAKESTIVGFLQKKKNSAAIEKQKKTSSRFQEKISTLSISDTRHLTFKMVTWFVILLQLFLPLIIPFSPVIAAINQAKNSVNSNNKVTNSGEIALANGLVTAGNVLVNDQSNQALVDYARSKAVGQVNSTAQQWLSQFARAQIQLNLDNDAKLNGSKLDLLLPLYDSPEWMAFTQLGGRNRDSRNTVNLGLGIRTFQDKWMYGINGFFDNEVTGHNRQMGVGVGAELWRDYLKLSANAYMRLTNWHQSRDFADYNERPVNGYDIRGQAYLPLHPQLGGKLMFEQYRGDEVALFGKDNRQKNPQTVTIGLDYTPIPLVTLAAEHRSGSLGSNDSRISLLLNYRLGESWQKQVSPALVGSSRTLAGSRYDFTERNNNIVLEYQKQELIQLSLPEQLSGGSGEIRVITGQVSSKYGLEYIDWNSAELIAAGGSLTPLSTTQVQLTLPPFNQINRYSLTAIAYDRKGNTSKAASTQIRVTVQTVSVRKSTVKAVPQSIAADGATTSQIIINLKDDANQPVAGVASQLALSLEFTPRRHKLNKLLKMVDSSLGDISESSSGEYTATLTAGTKAGKGIIIPSFNQQALASAIVNLMPSDVAAEKSSFSAAPTRIVADNTDASTLTFSAKDANDNPVAGLTVTFAVTGVTGTTLSSVTETNGIYIATLTGTTAGSATVKPQVNGRAVGSFSEAITLTADELSAKKSLFSAASTSIAANNSQASTLTFTAKDGNANPISGLMVTFAVTGVTGTTVSSITEISGVYTATLTGKTAGIAIVKPLVAGNAVGMLTGTVALTAGELVVKKSSFTAAPTSIVADNINASTLTFSAKDINENPVTGLTVTFAVNGVTSTTVSTTTEINGVYTATLTGTTAGTSTVKPLVAGNTVGTFSEAIMLKVGELSTEKSTLTATQASIVADNIETSTLTFTAKDANENPITGLMVTFVVSGVTGSTVSTVSEINGVYSATLRGITTGIATVVPFVAGNAVTTSSETITLTASEIVADKSVFTATKNSIVADNTDVSILSFSTKDANGNPVTGLTVTFEVTNATGTTVSAIREINGVYTASLTGTKAGNATVKPLVNGNSVGTLAKTIALIVGNLSPEKSSITATLTRIVADNTDSSTLTFIAKDSSNNPVTGLTVAFKVTNVTGASLSAVSEINGVYTAVLTGTKVGSAIVTPLVDGNPVGILAKTITLIAGNLSPEKSSITATSTRIVADGNISTTLIFTAKDANDNIINGLIVNFDLIDVNGFSYYGNHRDKKATVGPVVNKNGIYSAILVAGTATGIVNIKLKIDGKPVNILPLRIEFMPKTVVTRIKTDVDFEPNTGFPKTGFAGARFQLEIDYDIRNNDQYDWQSSQPDAIDVDQYGNLSMLRSPKVPITIVARNKMYPSRNTNYVIKLEKWFSIGLKGFGFRETISFCQRKGGEVPLADHYADGDYPFSAARGIGKLLAEWGRNIKSYDSRWDGLFWATHGDPFYDLRGNITGYAAVDLHNFKKTSAKYGTDVSISCMTRL